MIFKYRGNGVRGNFSLPQMLRILPTLLLTLVLISSCDSPSSSNQKLAQSSTPIPTIAAQSPRNEPSFCTDAVHQTVWFGPENVRQVNTAVPPPVPPGFVAGYSVGDFNAPCIMPKVGVVRMEAFIQTKLVFTYFYGNDRSFNPEFDPADTKASIILDFTKGAAQVIISPTCHTSHTFLTTEKVNVTLPSACAHANPLNGKDGLLVNWFRWKVDPAISGFPPGTEFLTIQYGFKIAAARTSWWKWFGQHGIPPINGLIHFAFEPDMGNMCLKGTIDDFPATAIHQVHYDSSGKATAITLARHQEARLLGPVGLTDPWHWTETHIGNQCGQSLTSLALTQPLKFGTIKTFAGNGILSVENVGDGGPATSATVKATNVVVDSVNNVYLVDGCRIRKVSPQGMITTIVSDMPPTACPQGLALGPDGSLYVSNGAQVRKVSVNGVITTVAGTGARGYSGDGGLATSATLMAPYGLAFDISGNLYIADYDARTIRRVDSQTGIITTLVTTGQPVPENATNHGSSGPLGIAVSPTTGDIVFSDFNAEVVYRIDPKDHHLTVIAGIGPDGVGVTPATQVELSSPGYISFDNTGALYIPEMRQVVRLDPSMRKLDPVAGNGTFGYSGDNGPALNAQLGFSNTVALDSSGNLYIADEPEGVVRIVYEIG